VIYKNAMNSQTMIIFLNRLGKDADRKLFLVLDNLRVHHNHEVRDWLSEHEDQIELFFLQSYCPELNPDEIVPSGVPARKKIN
jgi:transposase